MDLGCSFYEERERRVTGKSVELLQTNLRINFEEDLS